MPRTVSSPPVPIDIDRILDAGSDTERDKGYRLPLVMVGFRFQADDAFLLLDVDWKVGRTYISYRVINDRLTKEVTLITSSHTHAESGF